MDVAQMQAQARYWQAIADRGRNEQAAKAKGKGYPYCQGQGQGKYKGKGKPQANLTPRDRTPRGTRAERYGVDFRGKK